MKTCDYCEAVAVPTEGAKEGVCLACGFDEENPINISRVC